MTREGAPPRVPPLRSRDREWLVPRLNSPPASEAESVDDWPGGQSGRGILRQAQDKRGASTKKGVGRDKAYGDWVPACAGTTEVRATFLISLRPSEGEMKPAAP